MSGDASAPRFARARRRLARGAPAAHARPRLPLALVAVGLLVAVALVGPLVVGDPLESDFSLARTALGPPGPSAAHPLGVDPLHRDELARLVHGARISLVVGGGAAVLTTMLGALAGTLAGLAAGTRAAALDVLLMRVVDAVLSLPYLLVVTALGAALGQSSVGSVLAVLSLTGWVGAARLVRARVLEHRQHPSMDAARALGVSRTRLVTRHLVPNVAPLLVALAASSAGQMMLAEATLGYLSIGVPPPTPSWGRMLHECEAYLGARSALVVLPGLCILLSVLTLHRASEALVTAGARGPSRAELGRSHTSRWLPFDVLAALVGFVVLAWAPSALPPRPARVAEASSPRRGGALRLATHVPVRALDPALANDEAAHHVQELVYARLVRFSARGLEPDLAQRIDMSGTRVTVWLREGAHFHDGARVEALDVKRSLERVLGASSPSASAHLFDRIVGFADLREGRAEELAGVAVEGPLRLTITLREPDARFLSLLTLPAAAPVCPSSGRTVDKKSPPPPCGAGPFRVSSWDPDRGIKLERHAGYWDRERPFVDTIDWSTGVRATSQRYRFEDGELDLVREWSGISAALYGEDPAWEPFRRRVARTSTSAVFLNVERGPFANAELRRAVSFAIDPSVLPRVRPDVSPLSRVVPPSLGGVGPPMRRHDLALALQAMERAGFPYDPRTRRGGYPEPIDYLVVPDTFEASVAEVLAQQLSRVGLRVRLRLVSYGAYLADSQRRGAASMGWAGWAADFPDWQTFFDGPLSKSGIADTGSVNVSFFVSDELERVLEAARTTTDVARRAALYEDAERVVRDEAPWIPTHVAETLEVWQPWVRGYRDAPPLGLEHVWLEGRPHDAGRSALLRATLAPFGGLARARPGPRR